MVAGCVSGSKFRIGSGFDFVVRRREVGSGAAISWFLEAYNGDLNATVGTYLFQGTYPAVQTAAGGVLNVSDSSAYPHGNASITPCNFLETSATVSGNGTVTFGGTAYNGKYRKAGTSLTITATAASGYRLSKLLVNGSVVSTGTGGTYTIANPQEDIAAVAYFVPSAYRVTCNTPSGGTVSFKRNGTTVTMPITNAAVNDVITCTATPNADKMVQNFVVDGYVTSGGSTGPQTFTFTIFERADDATYECSVAFADRTSVSDTVVGKSDGVTDDATVTCNGATVTRTDGKFAAFIGNTYTATAHDPSNLRTFVGWVNANGETVSESKAYTWTQGSSAVAITALYADKGLYIENFYIGISTSDYGTTSGTAYDAGCRASISRSPNVSSQGKWLAGSRTVTATTTPTGWTFSGAYVSSTTGGSKFYKANGASSVTFDNAADANIYALFAQGGEVSPSDVDQGHSSIATGAAAQGLCHWENGGSAMRMRWHSKRYVASQPMALSTARVYADGYATGTDAVALKALTFQSPDSTDSKAVDSIAKSQEAYRLPMRRPEKYIELVVSAKAQVTQIAVATSMEALWQT